MKFHVNKNNTVPVKFTKFYAGYGVGEIAAFPEDFAKGIVKSKSAVFVGPDGKVIDQNAAADDATDQVEADAITADPTKGSEIPIPDNWHDLHHLQRLALAAKIKGEAVATADEADAVIAAEVARRAAA